LLRRVNLRGILQALGDLDRCAGDGWVGTLVLTG